LIARIFTARLFVAGILALLFFPRPAQSQLPSESLFDERSAVFQPTFEESLANSLDKFRTYGLESLSAAELARMQSLDGDDGGLDDPLLSLDLFRSLAAYDRDLRFAAESRIDKVETSASAFSPIGANAALLGALEFYAHTPLRRNDVKSGLARLNEIDTTSLALTRFQSEIHFWKAEGCRSLDEFSKAETEYRATVARCEDMRLSALTHFRMGELFEREQRHAEADSNFAITSRIAESPLRLLSLLRLGAVQRAEKNFTGVLTTMDKADSLFPITQHLIRTSARDLQYSSQLVAWMKSGAPRTSSDPEISKQLVSPFYLSEVELLRGSALSELGQYEQATEALSKGEELIDHANDSLKGPPFLEQARFVSDALRFEKGWSLFQQGKYQDASAAFLELAVADTGRRHYPILHESTLPLREQGIYFDPFLNDSLTTEASSKDRAPSIDRSVLSKNTVDTSFFVYNDFPERARYYAGVALARAGMFDEAADALQKLTLDRSLLYSDKAVYQLALIRFMEHSYEASKLLQPVSTERSVRGGYASFMLGELAYRRNDYERAEEYFLNSFANLPLQDTATRATAHLERGLSLIPINNWNDAADELATYLDQSHEHIPGRTDEALFWQGRAYFRAGEFDSAAVTFSRLLSEYPESDRKEDAEYSYAWSLFSANDFAHAEQEFQQVLVTDTISRYAYDALDHAGDAFYAMGDLKAANKLYNQATDRPGFNPIRTTRATLMLGITRMKIDSERSAMNAFEYLMKKFPQSDIVDLASFDYALSAYSINLNESAEAMVDKIVSKYPHSSITPRVLYVAGEERVRRGDEQGSLHYYEQVVHAYPRSNEAGPALYALQDALADLKLIPEALAVADSFVARDPKNPIDTVVRFRAGVLQMKLHDPALALKTFRSFIAEYPARPERPRAELFVAEAELAAGDTASSVAQLDSVIARYAAFDVASGAYLDRARIHRSGKQFDAASTDFQLAYQERYYSNDAAPQAMYEFGQMLAEKKRTDSAIHILLDLSQRYPIQASICARAAIRAGELLAEQRKDDSARAVFAAVIAAHTQDALGGEATFHIGETYFAQGSWTKAATEFNAARQDFTLSPELDRRSLFELVRAEVHLERKAEAIRNLREFLDLRPLPEHEREAARTMLDSLLPPPKKKHRKGGGE
jgi:TolA-binding protein